MGKSNTSKQKREIPTITADAFPSKVENTAEGVTRKYENLSHHVMARASTSDGSPRFKRDQMRYLASVDLDVFLPVLLYRSLLGHPHSPDGRMGENHSLSSTFYGIPAV